VTSFVEGELSKPSDKFVGGKSTMNLGIYTGPGTPPNTDWHHYTWTLIATDLDPKALQPGMTREELAAALKDHVKGSAGLVTRFRHPTRLTGAATTPGSASERRGREVPWRDPRRGHPRRDRRRSS
jgi:hypothetical protein